MSELNKQKLLDGSSAFIIGNWRVEPDKHLIISVRDQAETKLEPQVMRLLLLLSMSAGEVVSRQELTDTLWPTVVVGDDTLARAVSRLRRAMGDSAGASQYIQTVPKKGYMLKPAISFEDDGIVHKSIKGVVVGALIIVLLSAFLITKFLPDEPVGKPYPVSKPNKELSDTLKHAGDFYMRFTREDNEAAIALYERVITAQPDSPEALSGLANALVQRLVRWPIGAVKSGDNEVSIRNALSTAQLQTPEAKRVLSRAQAMAERALRNAPQSNTAMKALGLVYSAQGKLQESAAIYQQAIADNENAWRSMINLGEIYLIWAQLENAVEMFEQAYQSMQKNYDKEPQYIGPWQPAVGVLVAKLHEELDQHQNAEDWYRRVLRRSPLEREATFGLVRVLKRLGASVEAQQLCADYQLKLTPSADVMEDCELRVNRP